MENRTNGQFREDEIVIMTHFDKSTGQWVKSIYPKVGGRLRLAHEDNEQLSISTEIVRYDESVAVVKAVTATARGSFPGIGMASADRDRTIAPAILELAETRAIARSLRFAGYGVEYCSAEEISHLENGSVRPPQNQEPHGNAPQGQSGSRNTGQSADGGNGGNSRITNRQLNYLVDLGKNIGLNSKDLDEGALEAFGVKMAFLSRNDASAYIDMLKSKAA